MATKQSADHNGSVMSTKTKKKRELQIIMSNISNRLYDLSIKLTNFKLILEII